ncbi:dTDP-4-dehydrorhamnose reductase [Candidatus Peregrinibacteria bacterium]|nr:dTDP-4-dehydrorhamnose reductase [Candidatus Peregrinibacteria bacterium]
MNILLFGKNGMLGSELCETLKDFPLETFLQEGLDISDREALFSAIRSRKPTHVINAAAYTNVDGAETHQEEAFLVNAEAVKNMAEACRATNSILIHFSTDYVFDGTSKAGYREDAPRNPISVYGASKALGEEYLHNILPNHYIIRTSWLYGPNGKNFVDTILSLAKKSTELRVVDDQIGSPTFTCDLAPAILPFLTDHLPFGMYHRTNDGVTNWAEFAEEIVRVVQLNTKIIHIKTKDFPRPAKRPQNSTLLNTKLPRLRPWNEGLSDYLTMNSPVTLRLSKGDSR